MPYTMPTAPWVESTLSQAGPLYAQGLALGLRSADELARNQAEMEFRAKQLENENRLREEALQVGMMKAQQQLLMDKEYKDAIVGLRARGLDITQERQKLAADIAARKFAAQQDVGKRLAAGEPFEKALFANPELMTPGITEALIRGREGMKDYGPVVSEEVPGLPGARAVYRKGSPGVHLAMPPRGLTAMQRAKIEDTIDKLNESKSAIPASDPEQKNIDARIARQRALLEESAPAAIPSVGGAVMPVPAGKAPTPSPAAAPAPQAAPPQFPEGSVLRKKDGSRWMVQGGHIVPFAALPTLSEPVQVTTPEEEDMIPSGEEEEEQ